jgi:alpha-L-fucosidase
MKVNSEAVYGTTASPFPYLEWGRATRKGQKLYLHVTNWPQNGVLKVPLQNRVTSAYLLADSGKKIMVREKEGFTELEVPATAPDPVVSVIVLKFEGEPEVLPIPTSGKTGKASSVAPKTAVANLFDGDPKNKWMPEKDDKDAWVEVNLGEPVSINHISIAEPWHPWHHHNQNIEFQVREGDQWKTIFKDKTPGMGYSKSFEPVTGQVFRLKISGPEGEPAVLNEWVLNRAF